MATTTIATATTSAQTIAGGNTLAVTAAGSIKSTSNPVVTLRSGTTSLTNAGTIQSTDTSSGGARAIRLNDSAGSSFTTSITNQAGATITALNDAIQLNNAMGAGSVVTINNAGTIASTGLTNNNNGQAIDFGANTVPGAQLIVNNLAGGTLSAANPDAIRPGDGAVIANWGTISGQNAPGQTGADGIDFQTNNSGTVHNHDGGLIEGGRHGINLSGNDSLDSITVINEAGGRIIGHNGSGVGTDAAGVVINHGTITGAYDGSGTGDGDGVDIDYLADITNTGLIEGTGASGLGSDGKSNTSQGVAIGGGTVSNSGTIRGAAEGLLADDSSSGNAFGATSITNSGLIQGGTAQGIELVGSRADSLANSGTIQGGNGIAVDMGGGNDLVVLTGGRIIGELQGGAGVDTLDLSAATAALTITLSTGAIGGSEWVADTSGFEVFKLGGGNDVFIADAATGSYVISFGAGANTLVLAGYDTAGNLWSVSQTASGRAYTNSATGVSVTIADSASTTVEVICFMPGTLVATPAGDRPVESLTVGDLVLTADGRAAPIHWLGRQSIDRKRADPLAVLPVRISAGALGGGLPRRDLLVSPGHALLVAGMLVEARALLNGTTIRRDWGVPDRFTYWHVELADHALVLAEGVPAESFLDAVERSGFDNAAEWPGPGAAAQRELPLPRVRAARQLPRRLRALLETPAAA